MWSNAVRAGETTQGTDGARERLFLPARPLTSPVSHGVTCPCSAKLLLFRCLSQTELVFTRTTTPLSLRSSSLLLVSPYVPIIWTFPPDPPSSSSSPFPPAHILGQDGLPTDVRERQLGSPTHARSGHDAYGWFWRERSESDTDEQKMSSSSRPKAGELRPWSERVGEWQRYQRRWGGRSSSFSPLLRREPSKCWRRRARAGDGGGE